MQEEKISLVWLKRDLRLSDHEPIFRAIEAGLPVFIFYSFEPDITMSADWSEFHESFIYDSLLDMELRLRDLNKRLYVFEEAIEDLIVKLEQKFQIQNVFSHQEVGNAISYERDLRMKDFFQYRNINWTECELNGVMRGLKNRKSWNSKFLAKLKVRDYDFDLAALNTVNLSNYEMAQMLLEFKNLSFRQIKPFLKIDFSQVLHGGETLAKAFMRSFFEGRFQNYNKHISKPSLAQESCSRLAPYLSWGNLSLKQVFNAYQCKYNASEDSWEKRNLSAFKSRLFWRSHFIQKFETESEMEFQNQNPAFNYIRTEDNHELIESFENGMTGFPLVDASMRCLRATGYINFRMRAMLASFFTHILWQDWRCISDYLASVFLDYEPGIHYPQLQMQAGTTGVNTIRIYNPFLQCERQDPDALFVRKWIPELQDTPTELIHRVRKPGEQLLFFKNYLDPIVDYESSYRRAKEDLWAVKNSPEAKYYKQKILDTHVQSAK
ncbi:MAG: deoxyribodipyrimidine photo-lyase [Candidatus Caenarcaniphilales bacterium]|nr:deoxyribodipyrimidine photo-lyase [Candidatus Caenarcaniphilales bacterium]